MTSSSLDMDAIKSGSHCAPSASSLQRRPAPSERVEHGEGKCSRSSSNNGESPQGATNTPSNHNTSSTRGSSTNLEPMLSSNPSQGDTTQFPAVEDDSPNRSGKAAGADKPALDGLLLSRENGAGEEHAKDSKLSTSSKVYRPPNKRVRKAPELPQGLGLGLSLETTEVDAPARILMPSTLSMENLLTSSCHASFAAKSMTSPAGRGGGGGLGGGSYCTVPMSPLVQDRKHLEQEWAIARVNSRNSGGGTSSGGGSFPNSPNSPLKFGSKRSGMPSRRSTRSFPNLSSTGLEGATSSSSPGGREERFPPALLHNIAPAPYTTMNVLTGSGRLQELERKEEDELGSAAAESVQANHRFGAASPQCSTTPAMTDVSTAVAVRPWRPGGGSSNASAVGGNKVPQEGGSFPRDISSPPPALQHQPSTGSQFTGQTTSSPFHSQLGAASSSSRLPWRGARMTAAAARPDRHLDPTEARTLPPADSDEDKDESVIAAPVDEVNSTLGGASGFWGGGAAASTGTTRLTLGTTAQFQQADTASIAGVGGDDTSTYRVGELGAFVTSKVANHEAVLTLTDDGEGGTYFVKTVPAPVVAPSSHHHHHHHGVTPTSSGVTAKFHAPAPNPPTAGHGGHGAGAGKVVAVFKPKDEEIGCEANPRGNNILDRLGFEPGEGYIREQLAWELDHGHFAGVPETTIVTLAVKSATDGGESPGGCGSALQIGSLQRYIPSTQQSWDMGPGKFSVDEVHSVGIFDIRVLNGDRHGGNLLVPKGDRTLLVPIDHSYILPAGFADPEFEWKDWPQSKIPFSQREVDYIEKLDRDKDETLVRERLSAEAGESIATTTTLLKTAAPREYTLADIADYCRRQHITQPSQLEQLMADCRDTNTLGLDMKLVEQRLDREFPVKKKKAESKKSSTMEKTNSGASSATPPSRTRDLFGVDSDEDDDGEDSSTGDDNSSTDEDDDCSSTNSEGWTF